MNSFNFLKKMHEQPIQGTNYAGLLMSDYQKMSKKYLPPKRTGRVSLPTFMLAYCQFQVEYVSGNAHSFAKRFSLKTTNFQQPLKFQ